MMALGGRLEKAVALVGGGCLWMRARYVRCGIRQTPRGGAGVSTLTPANMLSTSIYVPHLQKRQLRESVTQWGGGGGTLLGRGRTLVVGAATAVACRRRLAEAAAACVAGRRRACAQVCLLLRVQARRIVYGVVEWCVKKLF